jgi:RNA 2',3'-cyclic 3'-phosphodiesterase
MSLRLFACLDLPPDIAAQCVRLQRGVGGAHWTPQENLHITLRFFGPVAETAADDLDAALDIAGQGIAPFQLQLKGADWFGKELPHNLHLKVAPSPGLAKLAAACERAGRGVGLKLEARKFTPHVTLAALNGAALERVHAFAHRLALFESRQFWVEGFFLWSSRARPGAPSLFREEAAYPLLGAREGRDGEA